MALLQHIPFPALPVPPSWYPGHMTQFTRQLPQLLRHTDVVIEVRDARLPLTSINRNFESVLQKWKQDRGSFQQVKHPGMGSSASAAEARRYMPACERIVVLSKRDLVGDWGMEPFRRAMRVKYPDQKMFFVASNSPNDMRALHKSLVNIARRNPSAPETNVLVVGMPNVGKSTLLNILRSTGSKGAVPKALQTSAQPGMTRSVSTRLKLSLDPLIYSFDSPGVMLPFLGRGEKGAERGVKLALIAGIKEGLYDLEALATYLVYRLNVLNPENPAYLPLVSPATEPVADAYQFLELLSRRLRMLQRGGVPDMHRAAHWFIRWWREQGGLKAAASSMPDPSQASSLQSHRRGWGFDFEWTVDQLELRHYDEEVIQYKMEQCIDAFEAEAREEEAGGGGVSVTQERKVVRERLLAKRAARIKAKAPASRGR